MSYLLSPKKLEIKRPSTVAVIVAFTVAELKKINKYIIKLESIVFTHDWMVIVQSKKHTN